MKKITLLMILSLLAGLLPGCTPASTACQIAATTLPVYEFTSTLCEGTGITVGRLVTENVSCLHDYTLQVSQMRMIERAELVVISGAGLEDFLDDALSSKADTIDASQSIDLLCPEHAHEHDHHDGHSHENDPHIWLSPENAKVMTENICAGLTAQYPEHSDTFQANLKTLLAKLDALQDYGTQTLSQLSCRELITFHDGFAYFAESFDLTILRAVEEESGSEASAADLKELIEQVKEHRLPAVFIECNGSDAAARTICAETGAAVFTLDMAMSGSSYFDAMYRNIDTIEEALG